MRFVVPSRTTISIKRSPFVPTTRPISTIHTRWPFGCRMPGPTLPFHASSIKPISFVRSTLRGCHKTPCRKQHIRASAAVRRVLLQALKTVCVVLLGFGTRRSRTCFTRLPFPSVASPERGFPETRTGAALLPRSRVRWIPATRLRQPASPPSSARSDHSVGGCDCLHGDGCLGEHRCGPASRPLGAGTPVRPEGARLLEACTAGKIRRQTAVWLWWTLTKIFAGPGMLEVVFDAPRPLRGLAQPPFDHGGRMRQDGVPHELAHPFLLDRRRDPHLFDLFLRQASHHGAAIRSRPLPFPGGLFRSLLRHALPQLLPSRGRAAAAAPCGKTDFPRIPFHVGTVQSTPRHVGCKPQTPSQPPLVRSSHHRPTDPALPANRLLRSSLLWYT